MNLKFGDGWQKKLVNRIEGFEFEVGILDDKPHFNPVETKLFGPPQLSTYAGGPVQKSTRTAGEKSTAQIFVDNQQRMNIDLLARPFREKSSDLLKFVDYFLRLATERPGVSVKRVENLLQAVVRNPILKQEYGKNNAATADAKGFDRLLFGTGQMFKAIKARAKRVRR